MKQGRAARFTAIGLLAIGVLAGLSWWASRPDWHIGPDHVRPWTKVPRGTYNNQTWEDVFGVPPAPPPVPPAPPPVPPEFGPASVRVDGEWVHLKFDERNSFTPLLFPTDRLEATPDGVVQVPGGGTVRLTAIGNLPPGEAHAAAYFAPNAPSPIPEAESRSLNLKVEANERITERRLQLSFDTDDKTVRWNRGLLFDARTHVNVGRFGVSRIREATAPVFHSRAPIRLDRDTPLVIVLEFFHGEVIRHPVPATIGEQFVVNREFRVQSFGQHDGYVDRRDEHGLGDVSMHFSPSETNSFSLMAVDPYVYSLYFSVETVLKNGQVRENKLFGNSGWAWHGQPLSGIEQVRIRYQPRRAWAVFRLDSISGMPNGRELTNLVETRFPKLTVEDSSMFRRLIEEAAQLEFQHSALNDMEFPADYFPKTFEDVTVRELLEELQRFSPGGPLRVHAENCTLRHEKVNGFWEGLAERWNAWRKP